MSETKYWCFTDHGHTLFTGLLYTQLDVPAPKWIDKVEYAVFQQEKGNETGKDHYQGLLIMKTKQRLSAMKKICDKTHWEATRNVEASIKYCQKEDTRIDGPWTYGNREPSKQGKRTDMEKIRELAQTYDYAQAVDEDAALLNPMKKRAFESARAIHLERQWINTYLKQTENDTLRPWQQEVINTHIPYLKDNPRKVMWIYDEDGNMGKTYLGDYLEIRHNWQTVLAGKQADLAHKLREDAAGYCIDFTRDQGDTKTPYTVIEQIKNRKVASNKYESRDKRLQSGLLIVFANFRCEKGHLSVDRYYNWTYLNGELQNDKDLL